ncbi:MAG: class I SAM-dependent rRNA methyltransferase [Pirellulaceae bacterium]|nr:class I SAM-dependent rRNA methyltransferase [Pirellulaceae bacterium]
MLRAPATDRPLSPAANQSLPAVYVSVLTYNPALYRKRLTKVDPSARAGDLVAVYHDDGQLLGYGLYNPHSEMAVRMVRHGEELPDESFWQERLEQAVRLRREMLKLDEQTSAYRVIHAEADGFPGLVVDKLGDTLSAEVFSLGMFQRASEILSRLAPLCGTNHWLIQPGPQVLAQEGFSCEPIHSDGLPRQVTITEFGTRFRVQFQGGHKTGFFCDQRENRRRLATFCQGRSVLDLCCYTGGFAVQAKRLGEAAEVTAVDLDEQPLDLARQNANLNQVRVKFVQSDAFGFMRDMLHNGRQFDVVVLDPPKLIRTRAELEEGTRKHFDLNRLAMQLVRSGGLLLSCTCAGLLSELEFVKLLCSAARQAGPQITRPDGTRRGTPRQLQILAKTGAAADHPIAGNCPETEYLNAVWMRLTDSL